MQESTKKIYDILVDLDITSPLRTVVDVANVVNTTDVNIMFFTIFIICISNVINLYHKVLQFGITDKENPSVIDIVFFPSSKYSPS